MDVGPVPGDFTTKWKPVADCRHRSCGGDVEVRVWESDDTAYEDEQYRCTKCGRTWWVEGPDA